MDATMSPQSLAYSTSQKLLSEFLGTAVLLATVIGSGIMGDSLAAGNSAVALLANSLATGAILVVLILKFGGISGAHFNPAVTLALLLRRDIGLQLALLFIAAQVAGGLVGMMTAHAMFDQDIIQTSVKLRTGAPQWLSEVIATFGLVSTILLVLKSKPEAVALSVGLYISAAYWFTASTSFANPAVTIARSFTNTFSGISPDHVSAFIAAQIVGAVMAVLVAKKLDA